MRSPARASRPARGSGRSSQTAPFYIALDIGGTTTRLAATRKRDTADMTPLDAYPTPQNYHEHLSYLKGYLRSVQDAYGAAPGGIGVSVGGRISRDGASVAVAPNLPEYVGMPLARDLAVIGNCEVRLAHDTVCGLLGERRFGALHGEARGAYLTLSTGTGAAVYLSSDGCSGNSGSTGQALSIEFSHQLLDGNTRQCLCGQIGCLETYTGGRQLALRYGKPVEAITDTAFWQTFVEKLALALINLTQLTRVAVVAVGGGIALNRPELIPWLQAAVDARLRNASLRLLPAALRDRAPLVGAAQLLALHTPTLLH
ncbi:MAG: ROK family protein [Ktedonobacterales bacterium]